MTDTPATPEPLTLTARIAQMFPTLTPAQMERIAAHGRRRAVTRGEVLFEAGTSMVPFFVVTAGQIEIVLPSGATETLITVHKPGQFTGEVQMLSGRAYTQAQKFGAQVVIAQSANGLVAERQPYIVEFGEGARVPTRTVVIATGAEYRKPRIDNLSRFEGTGVYYAATFMEAQLCAGEEVIVVGGGNSAGQAAVFLAQTARSVHMLVRASGLAESMSRYLIRRIEENPAIVLRTQTEIVALEGGNHLEGVSWRDNRTGDTESHAIRHVFLMTGASPNTQWLDGCVVRDATGFIKTGPDLSPDELSAANWPLGRVPHLLETSLPGVFAVGDVRAGSIKRVASAVGEGSIAIAFIHQVLRE